MSTLHRCPILGLILHTKHAPNVIKFGIYLLIIKNERVGGPTALPTEIKTPLHKSIALPFFNPSPCKVVCSVFFRLEEIPEYSLMNSQKSLLVYFTKTYSFHFTVLQKPWACNGICITPSPVSRHVWAIILSRSNPAQLDNGQYRYVTLWPNVASLEAFVWKWLPLASLERSCTHQTKTRVLVPSRTTTHLTAFTKNK